MPRTTDEAHEPGGAFQRECPYCNLIFRTDNPRIRYCSTACKQAANFARWYAKQEKRKAVQDRMREEMRKRRGG